jgi:hypothetical protein
MGKQLQPATQFAFGGLYTADHPLKRIPGSASLCQNLTVMPGNWLRLAGGRKARVQAISTQQIIQLMPISITQQYGYRYNLVQLEDSFGAVKLIRLSINAGVFTLDESVIVEALLATWDDVTSALAYAELPDSVVYKNGLGIRAAAASGTASFPAMSQWRPSATTLTGEVRYWGLYPVVEGGTPLAVFNAGAGNNKVGTSLKIYVGLFNSATQHYSNGVSLGTLAPSSGTGTILAGGLNFVNYVTHSAAETAELYYVFYATLDGYDVPYLILNSTLDGPFKVSVTDAGIPAGISLSIEAGTDNGWTLDATHRMPTKNYPPRAVASMCYVNGRIYYILSPFKNKSQAETTTVEYIYTERELASVGWSAADGDSKNQNFLGDPLESFDPNAASQVPSGQYPVTVFPAPDGVSCGVFSPTHTRLLRQQADGPHEWATVSDTHGIRTPNSNRMWCKTRHGTCWVTQNNQIAILRPGTESVEILSSDYDGTIPPGTFVSCIGYQYDPLNNVDMVMVYYFSDSLQRCLCHDFGNGVTTTTEPYALVTCYANMTDGDGNVYRVIGAGDNVNKAGLYSIGGQPDHSFKLYTKNDVFTSATTQAFTTSELPNGYYISNWVDFGDPSRRFEIPFLDIVGDGAVAPALLVPAVSAEFFTGFVGAVTPGAGTQLAFEKTKQELYDYVYRAKLLLRHHRWWKFGFTVRSHSADFGDYFSIPDFEGDLAFASNFYGAIMAQMLTIAHTENRNA